MENKKNVILILGIPGSGKSTLLRGVEGYKGYKSINVGTVMKKVTEEKNMDLSRDKIRYLNKDMIDQIRSETFNRVLSSGDKLLVDTHSTIERESKFITGLPADSEIMKDVNGIIYIDADSSEIIRRRSFDPKREREKDDEYIIDKQRDLNMAVMGFYLTYLNIPVYIINNKKGDIELSIEKFKHFIDLIEEDE
jgi:adenylate kinase